MIGSDGRRRYLHHVGANAVFTEVRVPADLLARARLLHLGGSLLMPAMDGEPTARLLARARTSGSSTSMDTAFNPQRDSRALIEPCLPCLDLLVPSVEGKPEPLPAVGRRGDAGLVSCRWPIRTLGIKLGDRRLRHPGAGRCTTYYPAYRVAVVDGSGAGDAFMAGFLFRGCLHGWDTPRTAPVRQRDRQRTASRRSAAVRGCRRCPSDHALSGQRPASSTGVRRRAPLP